MVTIQSIQINESKYIMQSQLIRIRVNMVFLMIKMFDRQNNAQIILTKGDILKHYRDLIVDVTAGLYRRQVMVKGS